MFTLCRSTPQASPPSSVSHFSGVPVLTEMCSLQGGEQGLEMTFPERHILRRGFPASVVELNDALVHINHLLQFTLSIP